MGIAGSLFGHYLGTINPNQFGVGIMVFVLVWVIVGGTKTFAGPIIGVTVPNLSGGYSAMMPNHHITKPVLIGEIQGDGQFDIISQTGLGSVHGLASPLGAFYPIPHGVVCGTLVATCTEVNIQALRAREPDSSVLDKYAEAATILCNRSFPDRESALAGLVKLLADWTTLLGLPRLAEYGLEESGLDHVVAHSRGSSMKTNPVVLTDAEIRSCLLERL